MSTIRIGIIGCGKIAQTRHIPEYLANEHATIVAYYDPNLTRAQNLAQEFGGIAYESVEELLNSDLDAVSICSVNHTHADLSIQAMKKGLDVLCEKPMATTLKDAQAMDVVAKESGQILFIGQNQRLTKTHRMAKQIIHRGDIGNILSFTTTFGHGGPETWSIDPGSNTWFFDKQKAVMGAMADLGIHKTDLITFLLNDQIIAVTARLGTLDKRDGTGQLIGVDDNAFCIYETKGGVIGTMRASWTFYTKEDNSTVIYGTKGVMRIYTDPEHSIVVEGRDASVVSYDLDAIQTNENQSSSGIIDAFIEAVRTRENTTSSKSVLASMRAVFAAITSSKEGRRVVISE